SIGGRMPGGDAFRQLIDLTRLRAFILTLRLARLRFVVSGHRDQVMQGLQSRGIEPATGKTRPARFVLRPFAGQDPGDVEQEGMLTEARLAVHQQGVRESPGRKPAGQTVFDVVLAECAWKLKLAGDKVRKGFRLEGNPRDCRGGGRLSRVCGLSGTAGHPVTNRPARSSAAASKRGIADAGTSGS